MSKKRKQIETSTILWSILFFMLGLWPVSVFLLLRAWSRSAASSAAQSSVQGQPVQPTKSAPVSWRATAKPIGTFSPMGIVSVVAGSFFLFGSVSELRNILADGWAGFPTLIDLSLWGGILACSVFSVGKGISMVRQRKRIGKYLAVMGSRSYMSVAAFAAATQLKKETVLSDLEWMCRKGAFGNAAYVDSSHEVLFTSADAARSFDAEIAQQRAQQRQQQAQQSEAEFAAALAAIRSANDRIEDAVLSAKIDRITFLADKIFRELEEHPEKRTAAGSFLNCYLPTTLKLLSSYADFDGAGVKGSNLQAAKQRIEQTMDLLVQSFEHQLDELYRGEAMDIDSDIRAMEQLLKRDGASFERDFAL